MFRARLIHPSPSSLHLQSHRFGHSKLSAVQMSSHYVRCAPNAVDDRSRNHPAERSSVLGTCFWPIIVRQDAPIVPSIADTAQPPAAVPYRASGLVLWHKAAPDVGDSMSAVGESRHRIPGGWLQLRRPRSFLMISRRLFAYSSIVRRTSAARDGLASFAASLPGFGFSSGGFITGRCRTPARGL